MYIVQRVDESKFGTPVYRYRRINEKTDEVQLMSVRAYIAKRLQPMIINNVESIDISYDEDTKVFTTFKYLLSGQKQYNQLTLSNLEGYEILPEEG